MEFTVKKLPKIRITESFALPTSQGLYFAIDTSNRVWYLEKTTNIQDSVAKMYPNLVVNNVFWISYFLWQDWDDLIEWESTHLTKYAPPLNQLSEEYIQPFVDLGYDKSRYLARYAEIQAMIKLLEQEKEELKPNIISMLDEFDGKIDTGDFKVWANCRKTYAYSPRVERMRKELLTLQQQEEKLGISEVKSILVFPVVRAKNK
jgi:hypothetical protein